MSELFGGFVGSGLQTDSEIKAQLVNWSLTSLFSTNMAISETKKRS